MTTIAALPDAAVPSPSGASLAGLDGINFFNAAMLAGFGPYVAVYLAEQKWTQENIGFVLTAGGLAGLLALIPGGKLLDAVRSKRALVAVGAIMVAVSAFVASNPAFFGMGKGIGRKNRQSALSQYFKNLWKISRGA